MEQANTIEDMADVVVRLTGDPKMADVYREHVRATSLIDRLVSERVRLGPTQRDMAKLMGVSQSKVARFEDKPDDDLDLGTLRRYAGALGLHMTLHFTDGRQTKAERIKASVCAIQERLQELTDIARRNPEDRALCDGIAKFQAEVLLNFLVKYGQSADLPRVFDLMSVPEEKAQGTSEVESGALAVEAGE